MNYVENDELFHLANNLQQKGCDYEEISLRLREKGATETLLFDIIEKVKTVRLSQRRKNGFTWCAIGVALLVVGCMITLFLYTSGYDVKWAMYGLTIGGLVFTFKGLVDIMGW